MFKKLSYFTYSNSEYYQISSFINDNYENYGIIFDFITNK